VWERSYTMFSALYDKADWGVGLLLMVAMVFAIFL
jgi:hypothetical protein